MITNLFPFKNDGQNIDFVFEKIIKEKVKYPRDMNIKDKNLIIKMLKKNPRERIKLNYAISELKKMINSKH